MKLKIKMFDEEHEKDLEESINNYFKDEEIAIDHLIDIKYATSHFSTGGEAGQIYSFSAMLIYKEIEE